MVQWAQQLEDSTIITELGVIRDSIKSWLQEDLSPTQVDGLNRLDFVASYISGVLRDTDPRLIGDKLLTSMGNNATTLRGYLDNWRQRSDEQYLDIHAQVIANNLLQQLAEVPRITVSDADHSLKSLRGSVAGHRLAVDRATAQLQEEVDTVKSSLSSEISTANDTVEKLKLEVAAVSEKVEQVDQTSAGITAKQQTAFTEAETLRSKQFESLLTKHQDELIEAVDSLQTDVKNSIEATKQSVTKDEASVNESKARIERILGIVGEEALIGSYSKSANDDKSQANFWRWVTVGAITGAIFVAGWLALGIFGDNDPNWYKVVAKLVLTAALGALAGYAGRQSGEHRRAQRGANHMATQLASVKPYLDDVDDPLVRDKLLQDIALKLFGQPLSAMSPTPKKVTSKNETALLHDALSVIKAYISKE